MKCPPGFTYGPDHHGNMERWCSHKLCYSCCLLRLNTDFSLLLWDMLLNTEHWSYNWEHKKKNKHFSCCPWQHKIPVETLRGVYYIDSKWLALPEIVHFFPSGSISSQSYINWCIDLVYDSSLQSLITTLKLSYRHHPRATHGNNIHRSIISHPALLIETGRNSQEAFHRQQRWPLHVTGCECRVSLFILPSQDKKRK